MPALALILHAIFRPSQVSLLRILIACCYAAFLVCSTSLRFRSNNSNQITDPLQIHRRVHMCRLDKPLVEDGN